MKKVTLALTLVFLCAFAAFAQNSGPSATGSFTFAGTHGTQTVEFNARARNNGVTSGELTFSGPSQIPGQDVDGDGDTGGGNFANWSMKVSFDCLNLRGNRASMSGVITEATQQNLIGNRVIFSVEDNGEGVNAPARDRFTWGVYRQVQQNWVPADAELPFDNGAALNWDATDFERPDDVAVPARRNPNADCRSFPLDSYTFEDIAQGNGNLQVRP